MIFLSTPSARRATFQNACGFELLPISIHALREEGDFSGRRPEMSRFRFLSTPSARRATPGRAGCQIPAPYFYPRPPRGGRQSGRGYRKLRLCISIHALREEGDSAAATVISFIPDFYPRPPRGGRHNAGQGLERPTWYFYPRPPRGGRPLTVLSVPTHTHFYPRPPRGGRQYYSHPISAFLNISIHALREEGDCTPHKSNFVTSRKYFYPRPPRGGRP